jgi:hypothetical protein
VAHIAILDIGREEMYELLELVVEPAAEVVDECPRQANNWPHFPRVLVCF